MKARYLFWTTTGSLEAAYDDTLNGGATNLGGMSKASRGTISGAADGTHFRAGADGR